MKVSQSTSASLVPGRRATARPPSGLSRSSTSPSGAGAISSRASERRLRASAARRPAPIATRATRRGHANAVRAGPVRACIASARAAPDRHADAVLAELPRRYQRVAGLLVRDELVLERAPHPVELLGHRLLEPLGLLLERPHPAAHPLDLLLELEDLLDAGEIHAELGRELLDAPQPVDVLLRVEARVLRRALRLDQPARLVDPRRWGVPPGEPRRDGDHVHAAIALDHAPGHRLRPPPEELLARVVLRRVCQRVDRLLLLAVQRARHVDRELVVDVAAAAASELRRALAAQPLHRSMLRAGRYAYPLRPVQRRDLHGRTAYRLRDRDRHVDLEVLALAPEDRRVRDARDHVQVAWRTAAATGLALSGEAHATAVPHSRGHVRSVALHLARLPRAVAGRARVLDLGPGAAALGARLGDREEALTLLLDPAALAARADRGRGARLRARAVAGGACGRQRHGHRHLRALHGLVERDVHLGLEVAAALGPAAHAGTTRTASAEEVGEDVREAAREAAGPAGAAAPEGARIEAAEDPAAGVIALALLRVGQDRVGLLHLLEALLRGGVVRVAVRVVLPGQLAVGLLDLVVGRLLVDAERLVWIPDRRHGYAATTTRAGRITLSAVR